MKATATALLALAVLLASAAGAQSASSLPLDPGSAVNEYEDDLARYSWANKANKTKGGRADIDEFTRDQHQTYLGQIDQARYSGDGFELVFYGDNLMQCMRYPAQQCDGAKGVYKEHFSKQYNSAIFSMGSDTVESLMYRLIHGERPRALGTKVAVLSVGLNDMGTWSDAEMDCCEADVLAERILMTAEYVADSDEGVQVVILGLLPRGAGEHEQPSRFSSAIEDVNAALREGAEQDPHLHFVDCADTFLTENGATIDAKLMPDAMLPNGKGFEKMMGGCVAPVVDELIATSTVQGVVPLPVAVEEDEEEEGVTLERFEGAPPPGEGGEIAMEYYGDEDGAEVVKAETNEEEDDDEKKKDKKSKKQKEKEKKEQKKKEKKQKKKDKKKAKKKAKAKAAKYLEEDYEGKVYHNPTATDKDSCKCPSPYDLRKDDSFDSIAERCDVSVSALAFANDVDFSDPVDLGLQVLIPGCGGVIKESMKPMNTAGRRRAARRMA